MKVKKELKVKNKIYNIQITMECKTNLKLKQLNIKMIEYWCNDGNNRLK